MAGMSPDEGISESRDSVRIRRKKKPQRRRGMDKVTHAVIIDRRAPSSVFSATVMRSVCGRADVALIVSDGQQGVTTLDTVKRDGEHVTSIVPLMFPKVPSDAVIQSIHCVNMSAAETDDFAVGLTYVTGDDDDNINNREKYLNIYSASPGASLDVILKNCKTLKLDFIPYQLNHAVYMSGDKIKKGIWLLSGSDTKIHAYKTDGQQICEQNTEEYFIEFKNISNVSLTFDTKAFNDYKNRVSFYGSMSRRSVLSIVDAEKNEVLSTFADRFNSIITTAQLFNVWNVAEDEEFETDCLQDDHCVNEKEQVCLLVGSFECTMVYMNVLDISNIVPITLVEADRGQSVVTSLIKDINFNTKNEIVLGTMENRVLSFEYKDDTWQELQSLDLRHQVHAICYVDLNCEGVKDTVVMTNKGLHILKNEPRDVMQLMSTHRLYSHDEGPRNEGFFQTCPIIQNL